MMELTRHQRDALLRIVDLEKRYGMTKWSAAHLGKRAARSLRQLDGSGLVSIERRAVNDFRYQITAAGRAALDPTT